MQSNDGQDENFYFANVFQEDAYANIMHVMQMFEPILMEVQKFIAAFCSKTGYLVEP